MKKCLLQFQGRMAIVWNGEEKRGFINHSGELVIPYNYDYADDFSEGLAVVIQDGKWGFVDKQGRSTFDF